MRHQRHSMSGETLLIRIAIAVLVVVVLAVVMNFRRLEGRPPDVAFDRDVVVLGARPALQLTVADTGTGLKQVSVELTQAATDVTLVEESFDEPVHETRIYDLGALIVENYAIQEGPASLTIRAIDDSVRNFFAGNRTELTQNFAFDIYPPLVEVLSGPHYINQGGSECVTYRVSGDAVVSGVQVGGDFFPGYPFDSSDPDLRFSLFAFVYDLPADTPIQVLARDAGGNEALATLAHRLTPRAFRSRDIVLSDDFLQKVVPEIVSRTPGIEDQGSLIDTYVEINSNLRQENHAKLRELSLETAEQFLWSGPFLQLSNSQVESMFADRRTYIYNGQTVDRQDHVGFDLSVVEHYPIEAANRGRVLLAGYFGIYGNTVLIDHGTGLVSLYGHMSSIDVERGMTVEKGAILGRSGATGLAGGDHLHFGLFLHGVPVNPIEWWDAKWIGDHVLARLQPLSTP